MALIHLPRFRLGLWKAIRWFGQLIYAICIRLPQELLPWASIRSFFEHPWTQTTWSYWIKPTALVLAIECMVQRSPSVLISPNLRVACEAIVLSAMMNSRLGRDLQELLFEAIGGFWNLVRLVLGCHRHRLDRRVVSKHAARIRTVSLCRRRMAPFPQPREPPIAHRKSDPGLLLVRDLVFNSNLHQSAHRADTPPRQTLPRRDRRPQNLPAGPAHPSRQHGSVPDPVHEQTSCHVDHLV